MSKKKPAFRTPSKTTGNDLVSARKLAEANPVDANRWKHYGTMLANAGKHEVALEALNKALSLTPNDAGTLSTIGFSYHKLGDIASAEVNLSKALDLDENNVQALLLSGMIEQEKGHKEKALAFFERAELITPGDEPVLRNKAITLSTMARYDEALFLMEQLLKKNPNSYSLLNDTANIRRDVGDFKGLDDYFKKAIELAGNNPVPYSNRLTYIHYDPTWSREEIFRVCCEWQDRYAPKVPPQRPVPDSLDPKKRLRIGLFSDGFRNHPVGTMIIRALENLSKQEVEIYLYASHGEVDHLTKRIQQVADQWQPIKHLKGEQFADKVREDKIDILIDLSGHNAGSRSQSVAMQPAPLLVKWVGGLINTTGIKAMDYLISDLVETPVGDEEDAFYVEKLIRLPDDYIVFSPPFYAPPVGPLPAKMNGYITLGCFNNPTKINQATLREWAVLMHQLPNSRLFLKGRPYTSESFCQRIIDFMAQQGIGKERLIIEGPASHKGLLEAYNRVDIALDSWPYSGGLTTCESLFMGAPVVTLPGPTFAGRHSATHLVNVGMPELVTSSWDEYRNRVIELAGDTDSLSTIRNHLRSILLQSPVCDGRRFGFHLMKALRSIWQRYCEDKSPETLTFDKNGEAWFKGEEIPVQVEVLQPERDPLKDGFAWDIAGQVVAIDNSSKILRDRGLSTLLRTKAFALISFDPRSLIKDPERYKGHEYIQLVPHAALGDGVARTLYACLDNEMSSVLKPLPSEHLSVAIGQSTKVLAELPIPTIALNHIEGLKSLDWLVVDELSDTVNILENGGDALQDALVLEIKTAFQRTHERQASLDEVSHWAVRHGFRFYGFNKMGHRSHFPMRDDLLKKQSSELVTVEALFIPNDARLNGMSSAQRMKLAFILHTVYGIRDFTYQLLDGIDNELAHSYLLSERILSESVEKDDDEQGAAIAQVELGQHNEAKKPSANSSEASAGVFDLPDAPFMSELERQLFLSSLKQAKKYFEFGSGGSTVWAVKEGLTVYGVESDAKWVSALKGKLGQQCQVEAVDIGPTKEWGFPTSMHMSDRFSAYSQAIAKHSHPFDLILVDGRFRVACTMSAILHILDHVEQPRDARIFIHDFWNRSNYHVVLPFLEVVDRVDTAGVFMVSKNILRKDVVSLWERYVREPQ